MNFKYTIAQWNGEKLGDYIALDTETTIAPFHTRNHHMVTCQVTDGSGVVYFIERSKIRKFLNLHKNSHLVMQNAPFDVGVLEKITGRDIWFKFYDKSQIWDTKILYTLVKLGQDGLCPTYTSLKVIVKDLFGHDLDKGDIRTSFEQYKDCLLSDIDKDALDYAAKDAVYTLNAFLTLKKLAEGLDPSGRYLTHHTQVKGHIALDNIYKNGLGFDLERAAVRLEELNEAMYKTAQKLATWGYVPGRNGVSKDYERIVGLLGITDKLPKSPKTGSVSKRSNDLEKFSNLPFIKDLLEYETARKLTTFIRGIKEPVVHGRFNPLLNSGRVSMSAPNIQQLPRTGGVRECFVPKDPNNVFVDADYSCIELVALSEITRTLYGYSVMGDLINEGKDLHLATAAALYKKDPKDVTKEERQFAKIPNFAYPANMGPDTFVEYCKPMGIDIDSEEAADIKEKWLDTYPELREYFDEPSKHVDGTAYYADQEGPRHTHKNTTLTGRVRASCTYTAFLNTGFQGLAADGCKLALYECLKRGMHIVLVMHDQIMLEVPKHKAKEAEKELEECMIKGMEQVIKTTKVTVETQILERFCK